MGEPTLWCVKGPNGNLAEDSARYSVEETWQVFTEGSPPQYKRAYYEQRGYTIVRVKLVEVEDG